MKRKFAVTTLLSAILLFSQAGNSLAVITPPGFPSCVNPSGTQIANYDSGLHGIAGTTSEYRGRDSVYQVTSETLTQCFCPESGDTGIQTNWLKVASISEEDLQDLKNQGWSYIPNGSLWGLDQVGYVAKNQEYACRAGGTGGGVLGASTLAGTGTTMASKIATIAGGVFLIGGALSLFYVTIRRRNKNK
ncbi:MAG: hypothetical protein HYT11_01375 [Candidatus Levybacteria bacterium]|nr:hypothetical protein [Candidatus Levybacteria bacterium]